MSEAELEMLANEAFIRRAAQVGMPFMLKGSYVTRQYFLNPKRRRPADLDWVYLMAIDDVETASNVFNEWAIRVSEVELDDGVKFVSFKEDAFWRRIDYAMEDDFPTVNTDLTCYIDGERVDMGVDISFNRELEQPPVPMMYKPVMGEPFEVQLTVPLCLQVSWKIHQTLVRPRFKDLFDLIHLVQHPQFDSDTLLMSYNALLNECYSDKVDLIKLKWFLNYEIEKLYPKQSIQDSWNYWRHGIRGNYTNILHWERASEQTDIQFWTGELSVFIREFRKAMTEAGWAPELIASLHIEDVKEEHDQITPIQQSADNFNINSIAESNTGFSSNEDSSPKAKDEESGLWGKFRKFFK
jgi:hypothetical protein